MLRQGCIIYMRDLSRNDIRMREQVVFGFNVFSDDLSEIPIRFNSVRVINTISPNTYGLATKNKELADVLKQTDFLVLDGVYFALASILLHGRNIKRNQGPDVFDHFMHRLNEMGGIAYFLGSTIETLKKIEQNASLKYPNVKVYFFSPDFASKISEKQQKDIIDSINSTKPDIVFVGMTCPKQEIWSIRNRNRVDAGLIISIGNVFDWFAGTQKRIHPFWFKMRLGWLIRIIIRPEIFKRNIRNQLTFFLHLFLILIHIKKEPFFRRF